MHLLPDITIDGHKVSLQDPYTIDGRLPKMFQYDTSFGRSMADVILDNGVNFSISHHYAFLGYDNADYIDELGREVSKPVSIQDLFERIKLQCNQYTAADCTCLNRLIAQNRASAYEVTNSTEFETVLANNSAISSIYSTGLSIEDNIESSRPSRLRCTTAETIHSYSEVIAARLGELESRQICEQTDLINAGSLASATSAIEEPLFTDNTLQEARAALNSFISSVSPITSSERKYIHDYDYKPKYIKHYMPGEDPSITLLLGAEIEVGGNRNLPWNPTQEKEAHVKRCIQIMNDSDSDEENLIYSTYDSTVQIELDTMPCSLAFHKEKMNYKKLFKYLDKEGYKGHDCSSAGLHIHANRDYLGKTKLLQQLTISKILYILEKFNDEICVIARRGNDYSRFMGAGKQEDTIIDLYQKYDRSKHVALNLKHKDTIEFRCFKSTLKYETFLLTLEFVNKIIDFAKAINIEEIETIKWGHLLNTFSDELRDYYYKRKVLEEKKAKEAAQNRQYTTAGSYCNVQGTATCDAGIYYNPITDSEILSLFVVDNCAASVSISASGEVDTRTPFERKRDEMKKRIKNTKKMINNSRNGLEKIRLQRELNEMQKELRELERRVRREAAMAS